MRSQPLESRVETLERRVTMLEELPARIERVESQIVHLRSEMRDEFSAVRQEMRDEFSAVRQEMRDLGSSLRDEIRATNEQTVVRLTEAIDAARREARILFEEVVSRIATLNEERGGRGRRRKPPKP